MIPSNTIRGSDSGSTMKTTTGKRERKRRFPHVKRSVGGRGVKVVYFSNPVKVKTSVSEFRATVQELTGRGSDLVRLMKTAEQSEIHGVADEASLRSISQGVALKQCDAGDFSAGRKYGSYPPAENESPAEWDSLVCWPSDGDLLSFDFEDYALLDVLN
ncbi:hypothetical protein SAY87_031119 [Trapa incisa]|uniref:VQ domain-containing protein n=1 Tax=Trapa incisa TaxID=236973 RepID=A0AAN7KWX5_9MYRT|nr:hypothetical protein SAY87_031119 [Trapa incisa]